MTEYIYRVVNESGAEMGWQTSSRESAQRSVDSLNRHAEDLGSSLRVHVQRAAIVWEDFE